MTHPKSHLIITLASKNQGKQRELAHWLEQTGLPITLALNETAPDVEETGRDFIENAILKVSRTPPVAGSHLVLAEDSGIVVDALDGSYGIRPFPGLYSNRWMTPAIRDELLGQSHPNRMPLDRTTEDGITNTDLCAGIVALMRNQTNRKARYCCGMVLWHTERGLLFQTMDTTELSVIEGEARGSNGFGYDPIVTPLESEYRLLMTAPAQQDLESLATESPELQRGEVTQTAHLPTMAELTTEQKNRISHRGRAFRKLLDYLASTSTHFSG